ncbi:hypothetical protein [Chromobacterium vaccinii]|uniref:hypothetical protein n=1 Tax=Chromobacterium vaccinii TaxID=1108595 RepID=UPI000AA58493|nr:hypothetical protein [Chromobacterium vaccinii]
MTPDHKNNRYRLVFHKKTPRQSDLKNLLTKSEIDAKKQEAEKNRAEKEKAENESKKALEEKSKATAEKISSYSKLTIGLASAYGFILLLIYCYTQAKFLPSGLSIGDSVLLLFFSIAFGFIIFVTACMGAYTLYPIVDYIRLKYIPAIAKKKEKDSQENEKTNTKKSYWDIDWGNVKDYALDLFLIFFPFILTSVTVSYILPVSNWASELPFVKDYTFLTILIFLIPFTLTKILWACFALPWYYEKHNLTPQPLSWLILYALWFIVESICAAAGNRGGNLSIYIQLSGFTLALLQSIITSEYSKKKDEIKYPNARIGIVFCIAMLLLLPLIKWSDLGSLMFNSTVVKPLGLYQDRASMWVSKKNLQRLENAAKLQDIPLSICRNPEGSAVVTDLKIWWHGIGSRSYVQLLGFSDRIENNSDEESTNKTNASAPNESIKKDKNPYDAYPRVELDSNEASLIASQNVRCTEISDALVFPSNKTIPDNEPSVKDQLAKQIRPFIETNTGEVGTSFLSKITVIGHADPMPIQKASNEELGRERATHALSMLCTDNLYKDIQNANIEIKTMGARSPLKDCSAIKDKDLAKECNAVNRRVDLQFSYSLKSPKKDYTLECFCNNTPQKDCIKPTKKTDKPR